MTCQQARHILASITVHNDRLEAFTIREKVEQKIFSSFFFFIDFVFLSRALNDAHTQEGTDYILSVFSFLRR